MAGTDRNQEYPLIERMLAEPHEFRFPQAVRVVEGLLMAGNAVGRQNAQVEKIRFTAYASLAFPASQIREVAWIETGGTERLRMRVTFLGLYGPASPLPGYITEDVLWARDEERGAQDFMDLFNHRAVSLFYRATWKYRLEHHYRTDRGNPFQEYVLSLIGLSTRGLRESCGLPVDRMLRYPGLFLQHPRSASALQGFLTDFFEVPVEIEQLQGRWMTVPADQVSLLGRTGCRLGEDAILGERVLDFSSKIRVRVGPLDFDQYTAFLPDGANFRLIEKAIAVFAEDPLEFDVDLTIRQEAIPRLHASNQNPRRLGYTSWLGEPPPRDDSNVFQRLGREGKVTS